jgi:hypothetical protein
MILNKFSRKKTALFLIVQTFCWATGFSENPRWKIVDVTPIPTRADLDVRWEASTKTIPSKIRIYRLLPNIFSPEVISNVITLCSFTEKEETGRNTNGTTFQNSAGSQKLSISFPSGSIHYEIPERRYGPTNLATGVPEMSRLPELATNFVKQVGIPISAVTGYFQTDKFNFWEPLTLYYVGNTTITNIAFRAVNFRRSVDGIPIVGGDGGRIYFGEYGKISKISITWHSLERHESYSTVSRKTMMNSLRQGKARQEPVSDNVGFIDWATVKSVTIKKALPCYFAGNSDWLYPFVVLFTTVDTGHGNVDVEIDCPIIDEARP